MAKTCTYCGQPLENEDTRFCSECGRLQLPEMDPPAAPGVIKVRLPPKEFSRRQPPPSFEGMRFERAPGPLSVRQSQGEQPAPQSSHLAKRPVRLTNQESLSADKKSETAREAPPTYTRTGGSARPTADQPASVEEISTMVLPGWREELEQLRKRQAAANTPAPPETRPDTPSLPPPATSSPAGRNTPLPPSQKTEAQTSSAGDMFADLKQSSRPAEGSPPAPPRPELRVRLWEQEPTLHYPQVQAEKKAEAEPALAVEHSPFAPVFGAEGEAEVVADDGTELDWQEASIPVAPAEPELTAEESERQEDEVEREEAEEESGVEDLPTVPLAVPEEAKQQPAITIERSSTPAPKKSTPPQEEIEDLPTRPMPASQAGSRSPLPPAPQPLRGREWEQREARPPAGSVVPNPPSSPGVYRQAPPMNAAQAPSAPAGPPPARGGVPNPNSQPGQVFHPGGMSAPPQGPLSSPGNPGFRPQPPIIQQRPPAFAQATPLPVSPRSAAEAGAAPARPRERRINPLRVALLVALIIVVGAGAFIFYYQFSSGGTIAQPYQSFQNSALGVFLNYPQGWTASLNQAQTSVHFADSSQTGQATLSVSALGAQTLTQYIDQEATRLGMTAPQLEPAVTFGGTSWQQKRGTVVQKGITYTLDLYATQHGAHIYTLVFMAPPPVYGRMEQESFAPLRASFRFIGQ